MNPFFVLAYVTLFSLAYAWAMVWITERRDKTYRQGEKSFSDSFLPGFFWLLFVWMSDLAVMFGSPSHAAAYNVALLTFLTGYMLYKEAGYRLRAAGREGGLRTEMRVLSRHSAGDPSNAVYFERASEIFEKLGEMENAVAAARKAFKLDPTVANKWRLEKLQESLGDKGRGDAA